MAIKIQKWGNSMGVRIPKTLIEKLNLKENAEVEIDLKDGSLVITPRREEYSLDSLLEGITKDNLHDESDMGPQGKKVW